jgi:hypothetical protein
MRFTDFFPFWLPVYIKEIVIQNETATILACSLLTNCGNSVAIDPEFVFRPIVTHLLGCVEN